MPLELDRYKKKLEDEKARLEAELGGVSVHANPQNPTDWEATYIAPADMTDAPTGDIDPMDVAETIGNYEKGFALNKELEGQLRNVDHALDKITAGTYGLCDVCKNMIPAARLDANAAAATCITHSK